MIFHARRWPAWEIGFLLFFAVLLLLKVYVWSLRWEVRDCIVPLVFWVWLVSAMFATPLIYYLRTKRPNPALFPFLSYIGVFIAFVLARYLLGFSMWFAISRGYFSCTWPNATHAVDFYLVLRSGSALFGISLLTLVSFRLVFLAIKDRSSLVILAVPSAILAVSIYSLWLAFYWQ